ITGVAFIGPEYGKRLELLKVAFPKLSRVALIYNPENVGSVLALQETQRWAASLGVRLEPHKFRGPDDFEHLFEAIGGARADALLTTAGPPHHAYLGALGVVAVEHPPPPHYPSTQSVGMRGPRF